MTDEIKEILDYLKRSDKNKFGFEQGKLIDYEETQLLLDYITNLQQKYDKLQQEIKIDGNSIQIGNKVCYCVDKDLIDYIVKLQQDLEKANGIIEKDRQFYKCRMDEYVDYKSRCEKAIEELTYMSTDAYTDNYDIRDKHCNLLMNLLNGCDENETNS